MREIQSTDWSIDQSNKRPRIIQLGLLKQPQWPAQQNYSTENACNQEDIKKYNTTNKVKETRKSSPSADNDKRITDTPMEETGTQMLMAGLKMDNFDNSPYFLMFLNNAIKNEETTADHIIGTSFPISTSHENILIQAKGDINRNWVLI